MAMPNRTKRKESVQENFHQPDTRFWSKERTEKRKPTKRGKDRFACLPSSGSLAIHPFFFSLSPSPSSKLHQKKKAEKKNPPPLRSWLKSNQKDTYKPHHTNRFAWASTLLLEARSDPLTGLRFPPPSLFSPLLSLSCHCTYSWLVPRMICRTAASCVSRLFITLTVHSSSTARTHARARGKKV